MRLPAPLLGAIGLYVALGLCGCASAPGRSVAEVTPVVPNEILDFNTLYQQNCSGCHGAEGKGGAAIALDNPVYLAIADNAVVRHATASGIRGASMPAFAQSAGGMLTDNQIDAIVGGIRSRWSVPNSVQKADLPAYSLNSSGDSKQGLEVYATYCASCHGIAGRGGAKASSIVDGSFLALVNDQELRTIVITGRPELGAPDWRSDIPGRPMSEQNISDVVAWLASQRPKFPGQPFPTSAELIGEIR
jgi:cytochrome c oxidase cbb3-type subunit 3